MPRAPVPCARTHALALCSSSGGVRLATRACGPRRTRAATPPLLWAVRWCLVDPVDVDGMHGPLHPAGSWQPASCLRRSDRAIEH